MRIFPPVEEKIKATFPAQEAEVAISALSGMTTPPLDKEWTTTRARVQVAIFMSSKSDLERLLVGVASAEIDWRDILVNGGLAESNWPRVAKDAGFDIQIDETT
ncbi:hypothetical protein [Collimonas fungivorans]|uniref:hypothetical protein n=1 Tax=Collimonas fungivorans TaxID=158899 RepID=UPI0011D2C579|nr:hypothetical protein [Collimonas fungivorans]